MKKSHTFIFVSVIVALLVIIGAMYFSGNSKNAKDENVNNVTVVDGKQIVEIKAKGGYTPVHSVAKAGIPTILRVDTNGTFDCSSSIRIPSLNIGQNLPMSGSTDIDIGIEQAGIFQGTCGMGMYPFDIKFE